MNTCSPVHLPASVSVGEQWSEPEWKAQTVQMPKYANEMKAVLCVWGMSSVTSVPMSRKLPMNGTYSMISVILSVVSNHYLN